MPQFYAPNDPCNNPACSRPNPPPWCEPCANVPIDNDFVIGLLFIVGIIALRKYLKN